MINGSSAIQNIHTAQVKTPLIRATLKSNSFMGGENEFPRISTSSISSNPLSFTYGLQGVVYNNGKYILSNRGDGRVFSSGNSVMNNFGGLYDYSAPSGCLRLGATGVEYIITMATANNPEVVNIYKYISTNGLTWSSGETIYSQSTPLNNYTNSIQKITAVGTIDYYLLYAGASFNNNYPTATIKYWYLGSTPTTVWSNAMGMTNTISSSTGARTIDGMGSSRAASVNLSIGNMEAYFDGYNSYLVFERDPVIETNADGNQYFGAYFKKITMLKVQGSNVFWQRDIYVSESAEESARFLRGGYGLSCFYFGIEKTYFDKTLITLGGTNNWVVNDIQSALSIYRGDFNDNLYSRYIYTGTTYTLGIVVGGVSSNQTEDLSIYYNKGTTTITRAIFDSFGSSTDLSGNLISYSNNNNEDISIQLGNRI